jgi:hypothetical protein
VWTWAQLEDWTAVKVEINEPKTGATDRKYVSRTVSTLLGSAAEISVRFAPCRGEASRFLRLSPARVDIQLN